ncbi:serine hydrolase [Nevskia sp.]|uniref:serine hydrolase n=1 Tax=Nevskia sp. TaxID=1929292 RepID=UPI0025D673AE|nr:serine hydrolase [Nevskia sp.]
MKTLKATPIAVALAAACATLSAHAATDYSIAPASVNNQIQILLNQAAATRNLPGISIAVSRHGESVYAGAAGWADIASGVPMRSDLRSRIGSVSKAIVTGPGGYRMLEQAGREPKQALVYGPNGLLGTTYDADINEGASTQAPIVEVDISSTDKTYTWYQNGTVSVGASNNLGQYEAPQPFKAPATWLPIDIAGIAIAKNDTVYTWVQDARKVSSGTPEVRVYKGTPTDLDSITNPLNLSTANGSKVSLPAGYSALNIVGMAIAKSNDHVYTWFNDGRMAEGTSTDLDYYSNGTVSFTTANQTGGKVRNIRGIGIASNDRVYAWFGNNTASSGWSRDLDAYIAPYAVQMPNQPGMPDFKARYYTITAQHLLDHQAAFTRSGDADGAAAMFNTTTELVDYAQIHRHFLRTRPMIGEPGKVSSYSNHGIGMWTVLVEGFTGIRFADYMEGWLISPMGLSGKIVPQGPTLDSQDAAGYALSNGQMQPITVEASNTGLAAGGYRASTQSMVKAMEWLTGNYSYTCINEMGWGTEGAVLSHNGAIDGGNALATIVPAGFKNGGGRDVGGFRIALSINRDASDDDNDGDGDQDGLGWMYELRDDIADLLSTYGPKTAPVQGPVIGSGGGFKLACQSK